MRYEKFGDTYDFVKHSLLQRLSGCSPWSVHPMFTDDDPAHYAADYCGFLGVPAVTIQSFVQFGGDRDAWLAATGACQDHLFLDPDTGLNFNQGQPDIPQGYLMPEELVQIVEARPHKLTLVYDQSFNQGLLITGQIEAKLQWLEERDIHGFALNSQGRNPRFLLVSGNTGTLAYARGVLRHLENHPAHRLIDI